MEFVQSCKNSTEAYLEVQRIFSSRTMRDLCKVDFEDAWYWYKQKLGNSSGFNWGMKTRKLIIKLSIVHNDRYQWSLNANFELITDVWYGFLSTEITLTFSPSLTTVQRCSTKELLRKILDES